MLKRIGSLLVLSLVFLVSHSITNAATLDLSSAGWKDITIYDGLISSDHAWYNKTGEDNEVEDDIANNNQAIVATMQEYDLEGIFYNSRSKELAIIGGYDYFSTQLKPGGDIFISTGTENYALDMAYNYPNASATYSVYSGITDNATLDTDTVLAASPWRVDPNKLGTALYTNQSTVLYDQVYKTDQILGVNYLSDTTFGDDYRFGLVVGLDWLGTDIFDVSYTMECGNDLILGSAVPEPGTMLLFGSGLLGFSALARRRR